MKRNKIARTIKEYRVNAYGYQITIPTGSLVSNRTARGNNDQYRFWLDWQEIAEKLTGTNQSLLAHDLEHRGIDIPAEYCEPYPE